MAEQIKMENIDCIGVLKGMRDRRERDVFVQKSLVVAGHVERLVSIACGFLGFITTWNIKAGHLC